METQELIQMKADKNRIEWSIADKIRDAGLIEPEDIEKKKNIIYSKDLLMDIYYLKGNKKILPTIVSIHGGGWFYGDKESYRFYCMHLAHQGFAVVNFNYRLAPENKYPAAIEDVCKLMDFIKINSIELNIDINNLFIVGDSAGAQLASQYCTIATSNSYRNLVNFQTCDLKPKAVALNCGIYDMSSEIYDGEVKDWYLPENMDDRLKKSFEDVLKYINNEYPSVYLMTSVNDFLKIFTEPMLVCLEENKIPHIYAEYGKGSKEDGHVFHLNMRSKDGLICNDNECNFFKQNTNI